MPFIFKKKKKKATKNPFLGTTTVYMPSAFPSTKVMRADSMWLLRWDLVSVDFEEQAKQ